LSVNQILGKNRKNKIFGPAGLRGGESDPLEGKKWRFLSSREASSALGGFFTVIGAERKKGPSGVDRQGGG